MSRGWSYVHVHVCNQFSTSVYLPTLSSCMQSAVSFIMCTYFAFQAQYTFIHDALEEYITCGDTSVAVSTMHSSISHLYKSDSGQTGFERQFSVSIHIYVLLCNSSLLSFIS